MAYCSELRGVPELHLAVTLLLALVIPSASLGGIFAEAIIPCSSGIPEAFLGISPRSAHRRDAVKAALASAKVEESRTKPIMSRAGLVSPVDATELTLAHLAEKCRVGRLICLARGIRALQSFPLLIRFVILHNQGLLTETDPHKL